MEIIFKATSQLILIRRFSEIAKQRLKHVLISSTTGLPFSTEFLER